MTISLEEHVARAVRRNKFERLKISKAWDPGVEPSESEVLDARAAIAAVREREGLERLEPEWRDTGGRRRLGRVIPSAPDPAEAKPTKATLNWLPKAKPLPYPDDDADPAEAMRAALETMVYETTHLSPMEDDGSHKARIPAYALAKARAALKGNGEGRSTDAGGRSTPERQGGHSGAGSGGCDAQDA